MEEDKTEDGMTGPDVAGVECGIGDDGTVHLRSATGDGGAVSLSAEEARDLARRLFDLSLRLDYSENELEQEDWVRIPMQYLHIYAEQNPEFDHDEIFAGADVECWIKDQTRKNALIIAEAWIEESGWRAVELEEQGAILREDHEDEDVEFFDQALLDEQVFVFNVFSDEEDTEG